MEAIRQPCGMEGVLAENVAWLAIEQYSDVHVANYPSGFLQQCQSDAMEGFRWAM